MCLSAGSVHACNSACKRCLSEMHLHAELHEFTLTPCYMSLSPALIAFVHTVHSYSVRIYMHYSSIEVRSGGACAKIFFLFFLQRRWSSLRQSVRTCSTFSSSVTWRLWSVLCAPPWTSCARESLLPGVCVCVCVCVCVSLWVWV